MKTVSEILTLSVDFLKKYKIDDARRSSEEIIAYVLGCSRLELYMQFDKPVEEEELQKIRQMLKRRTTHEPLQYILKEVPFYNVLLEVDKNVLIPRSETEMLVDIVVKDLKKSGRCEGKKVLDLCTGSGAIAISLKKEFPGLDVFGIDISEEALKVAQRNAIKNEVDVRWLQNDFLAGIDEKFDYIISNPPYVSFEEYESLQSEVKLFEPKTALVADDNGLFFYKKLADIYEKYLNPGGKIFLEIGFLQKNALFNLFFDKKWKISECYQDLNGKDRFFFLEIE
ncbi:MAG TPA: peptide chain release factor N(5)-glutamine methyltransferase [Chlamydiales bacterium]|nr:peptide chain release factor N(5)-glutamine methyltransferase [Chlamydiales bacterium]